MQITEIYRSLQGESSYTGIPCIFVRLTACNLRCAWCDSEYTFKGGRKMSEDEIFAEVQKLAPGGLVEITGGEPLLQERELVPFMERLVASGYKVLIETSGERPLANVPQDVVKIVDVKCPASGEGGSFRIENLDALTPHDEIKFVISDRADYEFAREFTRQHGLENKVSSVIFSPAFRKDARGTRDASHCLVDPQDLANWVLEDQLDVRLGLQTHKFIWTPETKGV
ncbi:Fe-S protein, radical SAM family [Candidatus Koribacter versatilis Ellin345]|uniref:7-carboxy-7-deazaguanine synthase n=1 Tax=Koribacter versatilis (strain Ellin345) TaxID=204669 RepID=QUEE_KORVE|nr:radical SAM protein [Candidatus Koribacter versatilis]Q1IHK7.1 RecName: Full=7-carboxy-7-deazaguanine synthase; Short=CDG synthase; AltName: Full=Queuosine biosynthesis protein QueE [Candidatus Koribacter versatilis Ellin345]ABF43643.1 Fe-S protein, radical SAM family [Candidatus Koribacter versatilis Ellin345]